METQDRTGHYLAFINSCGLYSTGLAHPAANNKLGLGGLFSSDGIMNGEKRRGDECHVHRPARWFSQGETPDALCALFYLNRNEANGASEFRFTRETIMVLFV